jgi:hypothetical protein
MEIFSEVKNKNYSAIGDLINLMAGCGRLSGKDILRYIQDNGIYSIEFEKSLLNKNREDENKNYNLFKENGDRTYSAVIDEPIPVISTSMENEWLKFMLEDPRVPMLLSPVLIEKLKKLLQPGEGVITRESIHIKNLSPSEERNLNPKDWDNLLLVIEAIENKKAVMYSYRDRDGNEHRDSVSIPFKIEYSTSDGRLWVILFSAEEKRPIKSVLKNLYDIQVIDKDIDFGYEDILDSIHGKKAEEPIVLEVADIHNALERCFYMFSNYEKEASYDKEKQAHKLIIYYYLFEEKEIIAKILSLGKHVKVLGPSRIRNEIRQRIEKALEQYSSHSF